MATAVLCCGAECGVTTAAVLGAHFGSFTNAAFDTGTVRAPGLRSVRGNPTAGFSSISSPSQAFTNANIYVWREYVRFTTLPNVATILSYAVIGASFPGWGFKASDSKIYAGSSSTAMGSTGVTITTGVWYCIDVKVDAHANPWTIDVQVDGVACGQATLAAAAANTQQLIYLGNDVSATFDCYIDDILVSQTAADYPLGPGNVQSFVPNADGTHTFTTTIGVRGTVAAQTGGGNIAGSTDSFNWLNARPIGGGVADSTRLWNQQSNGATLYGEVQFEDWSLPGGGANGPRAVEVLIIRRDAGTGTGDAAFKLNDNGTENVIFSFASAAGVASDEFHTKQYATAPSTGAAWTLALFNGVRFRFGYSGDANPDHFCRGVMIEAEFQPELGQALYARPDGWMGATQFNQLLAT